MATQIGLEFQKVDPHSRRQHATHLYSIAYRTRAYSRVAHTERTLRRGAGEPRALDARAVRRGARRRPHLRARRTGHEVRVDRVYVRSRGPHQRAPFFCTRYVRVFINCA